MGTEVIAVSRQSVINQAPPALLKSTSHHQIRKMPLLSARPVVTIPAAEGHLPVTGTKLYCLATET